MSITDDRARDDSANAHDHADDDSGFAAAVSPSRSAFETAYAAGRPQVAWTRLVADLETPVSALLKLAPDQANSFLLESVEGGTTRGRYSIIGMAPDIIWRAHGDQPEINREAATDPEHFSPQATGTLAALRALLAESRIDLPEDLPPMAAGIFGYMGYDTVRLIERLPSEKPDPLGVPDSIFIRPTVMVIFDAVRDEMTIVSPTYPSAEVSPETAWRTACTRLADTVAALERPLDQTVDVERDDATIEGEPDGITSNTAVQQFKGMVQAAKRYIEAGDIFQVVLSQRFSIPFTLPSFALYRALRRTNPSPFLFHLNFGGFSIVGSSPEILVRVRDGEVTVRPIAGTRPRGATPQEDARLADELLADEKELAEHLMLLDLGRNDAGRVSEIGSVRVTDSFFLEYYSQVMHIVSNVTGRLADTHDSIDALMAGFPAGTVSGAPKVRAMEIIDEFELEKRGPYAGCVGYFSADGQMDTCIVLRTAVVKDGVMHIQAGAGVVADSVPESEHAECENKAKALFKAAEEAERLARQRSFHGSFKNKR
ncbi:MAG: anthranilate synthase component I [Pseudomonadota bacterium]